VSTVGVRLFVALDVPSWGEVHVRISSGSPRSLRCRCDTRLQRGGPRRGALSDNHLSGDIRRTRPAYRLDPNIMRSQAVPAQAREMADYTMTGLANRGPSACSSGPRAASGRWLVTHTPRKDPL
jgi:hypothetical protein